MLITRVNSAKCINDPWAYGTDDVEERRRLFQCYMYIVLNDDPEANHYSLPAPFSPVFGAITKELLWIDYLPMNGDKNLDMEVQPWDPVPPVEYAAALLGPSALSEMTALYGDPRSPFHRKQAFDLGDSGLRLTSNSLKLGGDCLGHIKYFDGCRITTNGMPVLMPNVVCMHEVYAGIEWKHTNFRSGTSYVVRNRQLVIQCTATVANYEYIFAFILD